MRVVLYPQSTTRAVVLPVEYIDKTLEKTKMEQKK